MIKEIDARGELMGALRDRRSGTADAELLKDIDAKCDRAVQEVQGFASAIKKALDNLNKENALFEKRFPDAPNSSSLEMRVRMYTLAIINCKKGMDRFTTSHNQLLSDIRDGQKRRLRQVSVTTAPSEGGLDSYLDEKTIDALVDSGKADTVLQRALVSDDLRLEIAEISQRHDNVLALERETRALYSLFQDLATLVDVQQNTIDCIGEHIKKAKGYAEKGEKLLQQAEKHQKCSRKVHPAPSNPTPKFRLAPSHFAMPLCT